MDKRGLSPLMATILLIAFSVALGTIVMNWGQDYIAERAEFVQSAHAAEVGCDNIKAGVVHIGGQPQICMQDGTVRFFLENLANQPLAGLQARLTGTQDFRQLENVLPGPLGPAESTHLMLDASNLGDLLQVKLTPSISQGEVMQYCLSNALVFENLKQC